ncbi:hypothetical protein [Halorarum salinum]|uniref:Uncharacterized protein n=1 Tax=Halorarum salinum TaxID=2743089 RepID=A0A7D5Q9T6_9EURY|nr:hypothetical protein [Halobaculum salinum]QLG61976.1 hypothetical protein HUG12_09685 [Halobaculum salinum]
MKRRVFLSTASAGTALIAGCTSNDEPGDTPEETGTDTPPDTVTDTDSDTPTETESDTSTESTPEYDAVIEYTAHVQDDANGEYDLPEPIYDNWSWIVIDFEVVEGQLDMEDVWFNGLFETEQRYYTVSKQTDGAEDGIESRGAIRQGSGGVTLHEYPPSPASDLVGPMFAAMDSSIGGDGVVTDGPTDLYPSVTVEYSVETAQNPDVLRDEHEAEQGNVWATVNLNVAEGVLNLEDVWFRSQLLTDSRVYECDHTSQFAEQGVRARGLVKQGYSANALYQIAENESVEEWGYQEDNRQDVTIRRV